MTKRQRIWCLSLKETFYKSPSPTPSVSPLDKKFIFLILATTEAYGLCVLSKSHLWGLCMFMLGKMWLLSSKGEKNAELSKNLWNIHFFPTSKTQQYFNELSGNLQHADCFYEIHLDFKVTERKKKCWKLIMSFRTSGLDKLISVTIFALLMRRQNKCCT